MIVDEPEIHLHKAIQARLWDNIEAERPDCLFVYLTHDLDFAASRLDAKKLCFLDYDGSAWDWFEVPSDSPLPEDVLLHIVGSRKPVLFVEGERSSMDCRVYQHAYPGYSIMPRGNCEEVVHSAATFASLKDLHRLECCGIVDRDLRSERDVTNLAKCSVHVLPVAEVENLFLTEDVLRVVAMRLAFPDIDAQLAAAKAQVFKLLGQEKHRVVSAIVGTEIERKLKGFNREIVGAPALKASLDSLATGIDVFALYRDVQARIDKIVQIEDYNDALRVFCNKGLVPVVASVFGFKAQDFRDFLMRIVSDKDNSDIILALKKHMPSLP